jgi:hypothetical protein
MTGRGNVKEACKALALDMVDTGVQVQWKDHRLPDSSAHVLLTNVPSVLDRAGVESEIMWHLAEIEKRVLKKGHLPMECIGVPLPNINVLWRQNKQGKCKNKAKKDLSLHKLAAFQENGCLVCTVEASEGSRPRLGLLWEAFHKMGLSRQALGWSRLMAVLYTGPATDSNSVTMQHLHRVHVIHAYMISHVVCPNFSCVHKQVKIKMDNSSKPFHKFHKFTNLCREVMWLKLFPVNGTFKPLFNAIVPVGEGP